VVTLPPFFAMYAWPGRAPLIRRLARCGLRVLSHDAARGDDRHVVLRRPAPIRGHRLGDWDIREASLKGSSHYVLPAVLRLITGNIGIHPVHHPASRSPFHRLPDVLRDHVTLAESNRVTLRQSLSCARLALWDQRARRLVTFAEARRSPV